MTATKPRRFVRPWSVTERDGAYEVRDGAGLNLATVHFEDQPARQSQLQRLSKDEARRVAAQIARLPTLLRIEKGIDPGEAWSRDRDKRRRRRLYNYASRTARCPPNSSAGPARASAVSCAPGCLCFPCLPMCFSCRSS
jgi:hypothetical protein